MNRLRDAGNGAGKVAMLVWNTLEHDARVRREAGTLCRAGYEVSVYCLHAPGKTVRKEVLPSGVHVQRVGFRPGARLVEEGRGRSSALSMMFSVVLVQVSMLMRIAFSRPEVVHAHDVNMLPIGWLAARLSGARLVYDAHEISTSREDYQHLRRLVARLEAWLMRRVEATITTTATRARYFSRAYGVSRPLVLQNRPVPHELPSEDVLRRSLGIEEGRLVVLYQGGVQAGRGLKLVLRAAACINSADFVFVGSGRLKPELQRMASELSLDDRVHFVSALPVDDLPAWTACADIGLQVIENTCFNHFSTDSNKLFEYIMVGVPVIASNLPEIRKIVREEDVGILLEPGNVEGLVKAIDGLVENHSERQAMRKRALSAATRLSWESQEERLLNLYRKVLRE